jgi:hypothetical protein
MRGRCRWRVRGVFDPSDLPKPSTPKAYPRAVAGGRLAMKSGPVHRGPSTAARATPRIDVGQAVEGSVVTPEVTALS